MQKRHRFFYRLLRPLVILFLKLRFGYTYDMAEHLPEHYIVVSNHVTDYDMLMVTSSFPRQMYFVASEHIARWGLLSKALNYAFAPIMRPKGSSGAAAVMEMVRKARKGENVCLFAEGVRTWDGVTCTIPPATGRLIKTAGCGLVTYKIVGGYFASPMWGGASVRKGYIHGAPVNVYTAEQLKTMTAAQVQEAIETDLHEDAYARQLARPRVYRSKAPAEHLENLLFLCPQCDAMDSFRSEGSTVRCSCCGLTMTYNRYGLLENAPFPTLREFALWQNRRLKEHVAAGVTYRAPSATLTAIRDHEETPVTEGPLTMTVEALTCGSVTFPMSAISDLAMRNQRPIVFTSGRDYYELIPSQGSNALKFMLYYQQCKQKSHVTAGK